MSHSSSMKSHKFFNTVDKTTPSSAGEFNFGDNINQWKKYLEVDEFVSFTINDVRNFLLTTYCFRSAHEEANTLSFHIRMQFMCLGVTMESKC